MNRSPFSLNHLIKKLLLPLACAALLAACSSDKLKPAELEPNVPLLGVAQAWANRIGEVNFPLNVRVVGERIFVADSSGTVAALDSVTGQDVWRVNVGAQLSAGVGSDGRYAVVVSKDNELIVIEGGAVIWRQPLQALTVTTPLVAGARVFTLSADRSVAAFDAGNGRRLWLQERKADPLVLGQAGLLMASGDTLVAGIGGRLVGMNPSNGSSRWETALANSRGTNEVERLIDVVAGYSRDGDVVCARSFQYAVACVDTSVGRTLWTKTSNGNNGVTGNADSVFGAEADGKLAAWQRKDGQRLWLSERLRYRNLSAPLVAGRALVVGDDSGTLHFLSKDDASPLNRLFTDSSGITVQPVLAGKTLVVVSHAGSVYAYRPE